MVKSIYNKLPLPIKRYLFEKKGLRNLYQYKKNIRLIEKSVKSIKYKDKELLIKDGLITWEKAFKKFILAQPTESEIANQFFSINIRKLKKSNVEFQEEKPILICAIKNDIYRIKKLFEHYRKLGIEQFAIIDNDSNDGTLEYLLEQGDTEVFQIKEKYTTNNREAWINRIIAYYGIERWYINVDSDELLIYNNCENKSIKDVISYLEKNNIFRARALMVDMYSNEQLFNSNNTTDSYTQMVYFDADSYIEEESVVCDLIKGGPRERVFRENPLLTKYPIFKFIEGTIQGKSHYQYPYKLNKGLECHFALLHFKFLANDFEKYKKIAEDGSYYNGSKQYKDYINVYRKNPNISFYEKKSKKYVDSSSLYSINLLKKINWGE